MQVISSYKSTFQLSSNFVDRTQVEVVANFSCKLFLDAEMRLLFCSSSAESKVAEFRISNSPEVDSHSILGKSV